MPTNSLIKILAELFIAVNCRLQLDCNQFDYDARLNCESDKPLNGNKRQNRFADGIFDSLGNLCNEVKANVN